MPQKTHFRAFFRPLILLLLLAYTGIAHAQDLEPRRWSPLPTGLNVLGVGTAMSSGDILFDPVLLLEDTSFDLYATGVSYVRTLDIYGKTARVDVVAPLATGRWEGLLDGVNTSVRRKGLVDPWLRFSVNLYGAPALKGKEFLQYRSRHKTNTTVGAAVTVIMPLGEYSQDYLINLGSNRWIVRPQLGVLHQREKWQFELTGSVFLHEANHEFWKGTVRKQDPLWFVQSHAIYSINQRWWASLSGGFAQGGRNWIDGIPKLDDSRVLFLAASTGVSIARNQNVKITYLRRRTHTSVGIDSDTFSVGWSYNWSR